MIATLLLLSASIAGELVCEISANRAWGQTRSVAPARKAVPVAAKTTRTTRSDDGMKLTPPQKPTTRSGSAEALHPKTVRTEASPQPPHAYASTTSVAPAAKSADKPVAVTDESCPTEEYEWEGELFADEEVEEEVVEGEAVAEGEGETITRAPAPLVILLGHENTLRHTSGDAEAVWVPVDYQRLSMQCEPPEGIAATSYEFYVDGHPFSGVREVSQESLDCPPLGRHLIQARYLHPELGWSRISAPVRFEVLAPRKPKIIAAGDYQEIAGPLVSGGLIPISSGDVQLRLAGLSQKARIHVYVDGVYLGACTPVGKDPCVVEFNVGDHITLGDHEITVRQSPMKPDCALASDHSDPIRIRYQRSSVAVHRRSGPIETGTTTEGALTTTSEKPAPAPASKPAEEAKDCKCEKCQAAKTESAKPVGMPASPAKGPERAVYTFNAVARFPFREHALRGEPIETDGVLIYEGMTLAVNSDGRYEVRFRTTTPRLPAMLRLQFEIKINNSEWHTLTLPPVHVLSVDERANAARRRSNHKLSEVDNDPDLTEDGDTQTFKLAGDLTVLKALGEAQGLGQVRRSGTVRFGYDRAQTAVPYVQ